MNKTILVLVILGVLLSACGNSESAIATAIADSEAVKIEVEKHLTSIALSATPTATSTLKPTATFTPAPTDTPTRDLAQEKIYLDQVSDLFWNDFLDQTTEVLQIFDDISENPEVVFDTFWWMDANRPLAYWFDTARSLAAIENVPPRYEYLHSLLVELEKQTSTVFLSWMPFIQDPLDYDFESMTNSVVETVDLSLEIAEILTAEGY